MPKKYILLDRDGTILVNKHYQKDPDETELLPNAKAGLDLLRANGFGLVVLSNQSGINRNLLTRADAQAVNRRMAGMLSGGESQNNGKKSKDEQDEYFAGIYCCPHRPDENCQCRKPLPGLAEQAAKELGFTLAESYMIGDSEADTGLGAALSAATILVRTGNGAKTEASGNAKPNYTANDLLDAAEWILRRETAKSARISGT